MKLYRFLIFCLPFLAGAKEDDNQEENITCDPNVHITGGTLTKSNGNAVDSVLRFQCPEHTYPYPVSETKCTRSGHWFRLTYRRTKPICKEFRCPMPVLEDGMIRPQNLSYAIGETVFFECYDGYKLQGSISRTCMKNGRWNGTITSCNSGSQYCPHPGIPAGGRKSGENYMIGSKVEYVCNNHLVLVGSSVRQCLESREWSGREPSCQYKNSFDTPEDVASAFTASFTNMLGMTQTGEAKQPASTARKITLTKDAPLHIYILLDASESVGEANFNEAKNIIKNLTDKIASFDIQPKFGIISYASEPKVISDINIQETATADEVIYLLDNGESAQYEVHADKRGTNIHAAFKKVLEMMVLSKIIYKDSWGKTRFVTILFTDGKSNMGGDPRTAVREIKDFIFAQNKSDDYLDMYSFGVTDGANILELNALSSKKHDEKHCFILKSTTELIKAFDDILDFNQIGDLCGVADENVEKSFRLRHPWHVLMEIPGIGSCSGSIVSPEWVLTAAHCLKDVQTKLDIDKITVQIGDKFRFSHVKDVYIHPQYNLSGLLDEKISQFYDYDVALLKLKKRIDFADTKSRSICLPCTSETTRAIRKPFPGTNCRDHENELLPTTRSVPASFVKRDRGRLETEAYVSIKTTEALRDACEANALHAEEYKHVTDVRMVVTDRFLCTGGQDPVAEEVSCKGDSGGALYMEKKRRLIQVGVISWGVINVCDTVNADKNHARDFHVNLFKVLPWLKERLGKIMTFID
ncbi:complement factor B-like [Chiloscyllium plagiosum]|uniref:complement factor B-like n=1 Tax=Chiloscyllium plagiosum TaxID=36176 RepID=UPI001CB7CC07|nr:complement factor B-like [Chiloscyllium plagiosum]